MSKIKKIFGLEIIVDREVPRSKYDGIVKELASEAKRSGLVDNLELYVHHIRFAFTPRHFAVAPLRNRVEAVAIRLSIPNARQSGMKFVNHRFNVNASEIPIASKETRLSYELAGAYCEDRKSFDSYIALTIPKTCAMKHRKLDLTASVVPTNAYRERLYGYKGPIVTKLSFMLSRDIQLRLELE